MMKPVAIAGMHRSGTSMVARQLNLVGLYLGDEADLIPASPENPDGYWEHVEFVDVNDALLHEFGGGWDHPVTLPADWQGLDRLAHLQARAHQLVEGFAGRQSWGWKDPRTSLMLPFWRTVVPDARVVLCLRHPLEVALSLQRRGMSSYSLSLSLWETYNRRVLEATEPESRIVTHYDGYFGDPAQQLARVADFAGMRPSTRAVTRAATAVKPANRHSQFTPEDLRDAGAAPDLRELYARLLDEAQGPEVKKRWSRRRGRVGKPSPTQPRREVSGQQVIDVGAQRVDRRAMDAEVLQRNLREVRDEVQERDRTIATLHQHLAEAESALQRVQGEADLATRALDQLGGTHDRLVALVEGLQAQLDRRGNEIQSTLHALHGYQTGLRSLPPAEGPEHSYHQDVDRLREVVHEKVPQHATVLVASHGDGELVKLYGRQAWHFPRLADGAYAGHHPPNSTAAIVHLKAMHALGAGYLVVPATMSWWFDHYAELRSYLESHCRLVHRQDETCRIYSLDEPPRGNRAAENEAFRQLVDEFHTRFDRDPVVLDWATGRDVAGLAPELQVFSPPVEDTTLAYLDRTVDIVVVASSDPDRIAETRRVASSAALILDDDSPRSGARVYGRRPPEVVWLAGPASALPSASIVIPCYDGLQHTQVCLETLLQTLTPGLDCEVVVVDDASRDRTGEYLRKLARTDDRVTVIRNPSNVGYLASVNRGAQAASGDILVFLNNDTILLPNWISALLRTFRRFSDAGVVGGKLLYPDGRVQEAGGVVFRDGSAAKFGAFDPDPTSSLYNFVRDVDYCSGALLATPRALFEQLDGFDPSYGPGYYEDTDYCFRARADGRRVLYQPASTIIHLEGATAGLDVSKGMKLHQVLNHERFVTRWAEVLRSSPERPPEPFDFLTLYELAGAMNGANT